MSANIKRLSGPENYRAWKIHLQNALEARGLWSVVTGLKTEPTTETHGSNLRLRQATLRCSAMCQQEGIEAHASNRDPGGRGILPLCYNDSKMEMTEMLVGKFPWLVNVVQSAVYALIKIIRYAKHTSENVEIAKLLLQRAPVTPGLTDEEMLAGDVDMFDGDDFILPPYNVDDVDMLPDDVDMLLGWAARVNWPDMFRMLWHRKDRLCEGMDYIEPS